MAGRRGKGDPRPVKAAGGVLVRRVDDRTMTLLIHRKGVWDLPKGKLDDGESVEACARREVCEELGIDEVRIVAPLGTTEHTYREGRRRFVKTTWWFLMHTDAERFRPQESEQIKAVAWMEPDAAIEHLAYDTLRELLRRNRAHLTPA